jgi:hypothetical protein
MHLFVLRILYHSALAIWGPTTPEGLFTLPNYNTVFIWYLAMIVPLYIPTVWYSRLKRRRPDIAWLKYF